MLLVMGLLLLDRYLIRKESGLGKNHAADTIAIGVPHDYQMAAESRVDK
jgi:hypothetical protein